VFANIHRNNELVDEYECEACVACSYYRIGFIARYQYNMSVALSSGQAKGKIGRYKETAQESAI
jgi:hypothetical protein